jgi:hypothetical protein
MFILLARFFTCLPIAGRAMQSSSSKLEMFETMTSEKAIIILYHRYFIIPMLEDT